MNTVVKHTKDFEGWIIKKKDCHFKLSKPPMFKERDIWWVSVGVNVGFEEDGKHDKYIRPVLVLRKFNRYLFLGIPMSTKNKDNPYYLKVTVGEKVVSVLLSQLRVFSANRIEDKLAEIDTKDFNRVKNEVVNIISFSLPQKRKSRG